MSCVCHVHGLYVSRARAGRRRSRSSRRTPPWPPAAASCRSLPPFTGAVCIRLWVHGCCLHPFMGASVLFLPPFLCGLQPFWATASVYGVCVYVCVVFASVGGGRVPSCVVSAVTSAHGNVTSIRGHVTLSLVVT
eukprot:478103-Rhodomonas_salina.1